MVNNLVKKLCYFENRIQLQYGGNKKDNKDNKKDNIYDMEYLLELLGNKDWEKIIELFKNPRDIKVNGNNLLHLACSRGEIEAINYYLLKYPELFYVSNSEGDTCGHILAKYGYFDILKKLLPKFPEVINFLNKDGNNLLDLTITEPTIMSYIINLIDPEYFREMDAAKISSLKSMIELIKLNNGQDIYLQLINRLISKGFQINQPSPYIPLIVASKLNRTMVTETLLSAGADPNIKDANHLTPLIHGVKNSAYDSVKKLLEGGADINYAGPESDHMPIYIALNNRDNMMIDILLKKKYGLNYSYTDRNLETPIHIALKNNLDKPFMKPSSLFKLIYESDLNIPNLMNCTPLHLLAKYSNIEDLKYYSESIKNKKLNLTIKDNNMKTPSYYLSRENKKIFNTANPISDIKKSNIIMPSIRKTNFSLFNSDILHNAIYTAMILRKYKNLAIPTQKYDITINRQSQDFNNMANYKSTEGILIRDIINTYFENFYTIMPHLLLWKSHDLFYYNKAIKKSVKSILKNKKIDYIMLKLSLIPNNGGTHANILIYDIKKNILERFEPFGPNDMLDESELNRYIEMLAKKIFNNKVKYISPKLFMNDTKFQLVSSDSDPENKKAGDPIGYCMAWCFWYLELRLQNPNTPSDKLVEDAFKNILKNRDMNSNQVLDYIRNYSNSLDGMKNKFLKESGVPKKEYYNMNYDDDTLNRIIENLDKEF